MDPHTHVRRDRAPLLAPSGPLILSLLAACAGAEPAGTAPDEADDRLDTGGGAPASAGRSASQGSSSAAPATPSGAGGTDTGGAGGAAMGGASGVAAGGAAGAAAPPPAAPADASPAPAARADAGTASAPGETDNGDCKDIDKKLLLVEKGPTCSSPSPRPAFRRSGMSAGCGKAAPAAGKRSLEVCAGKPRDFILQLPQNYDPQKAYPLVFTFHHAYGYAESPLGYGGLAKSLADKAIIISPQALSPKVKPCFTTWSRNFKDDLALFDALVDFATNNLCVDQGKLFATGLSSGGFFSTSLGCQRGDVLRGIMPVAGGLRDFYSCKGGVGALLVLQPNDTNVRDSFLKLNGCTPSATPPASQPDPKICASYTCKPETPVTHCTYGHAWPSWATKAMWDFWTVLPPVP